MGLCPGFLRNSGLDRWNRIGFVGDGESEAVGFEPGFRPGKVGFGSGSIFENCTVLNSGVLDNYGNQGVTIDDGLLDYYGVFLMRRVRNCIATIPADGAGCGHNENEDTYEYFFHWLLIKKMDLFVYSVLFQNIDVEPGNSVFHPDRMRKSVNVLDDLLSGFLRTHSIDREITGFAKHVGR